MTHNASATPTAANPITNYTANLAVILIYTWPIYSDPYK